MEMKNAIDPDQTAPLGAGSPGSHTSFFFKSHIFQTFLMK